MEKVKTFEAHQDYIRCIVVHPTQPYVFTSSDDMTIKLWDWDKKWMNTQIFEGHSHYVMQLAINPKDTNTFASCSLDRTIKVWGIGSKDAHFTLEGHTNGINCIDYYTGGDKPYLISGADDKVAKVWDYQNKTCVQTLEGHTHNVAVVGFHPELPVIVTGSEDGTVRVWHSNTYRLEKTLNYGLERVWSIAMMKGTNLLCVGYDEGCVVVKLGREEPAVSMDVSGKIIWARHNEIQTVNVKTASDTDLVDGERINLATKDLGYCEIFPQKVRHNANGRFVVACGDGEYIIYTALGLRNKSFGSGLDFVWANETGGYAVRESTSKVKIFKNFVETQAFRPTFSVETIFGGVLLALRGRDFVCLYDWEELRLIRRIEVVPKAIYWSDNAEHVTIATESSFFILKFNKDAVAAALAAGTYDENDGVEEAFDVLNEVPERVRTGHWIGDCFIYTNAHNRLNYCVGEEIVTIAHLDRHMYLLGYLPTNNRLYLCDKQMAIVSYSLHMSIINFQTAVVRKDIDTANAILPKIPADQHNRIAQFLDAQGFKEQALKVSNDPDHRFTLAVQLGMLDIALDIAKESDSDTKWKQLGTLALQANKLELALQCLENAQDLGGLLLLHTSTGNASGLLRLADIAVQQGKNNIAFICWFLSGQTDQCIKLLCDTGRIPEAAFLARTYAPSKVSELVALWKDDLKTVNKKAAESLANPSEFENLFPDFGLGLQVEQQLRQRMTSDQSARAFPRWFEAHGNVDLVQNIKQNPGQQQPPASPQQASTPQQVTPAQTPSSLIDLDTPSNNNNNTSISSISNEPNEDALAAELEAELMNSPVGQGQDSDEDDELAKEIEAQLMQEAQNATDD